MADLASNTAYLTVLEQAPLENVGWYARVLSQRDYASVVGEVTRFIDLGFSVEANDCGGGKVTLDAEASIFTTPMPLGETVPVVEQEALWQILEDGVVRAEFLAEDVVEDVIVDDDGRRGTIINGRSTACVLEWAKVLPEGMPTPTSTQRTFEDTHPMAAWHALFAEAQTDGYLTWVQLLFDDSTDSAGEAWGPGQSVTVQAGEDLLALLIRWCEQNEMSWRMLPGWKLQVFRNAGHHREETVVFVQHRGQKRHDRTITRRDIANVVYADGGDGGIAIAASTSSQDTWRKRAAWVSAGDSGDATARSAVANATLAQTAQQRVSRSVQVPIDRPGRRPFVDFDVHDWITIELPDGSADSGANRVVGIAVEVTETGAVSGELTLQSKAEVQAVRLQRLIDKLGGSTGSGSGSEASTPIPVAKALLKARLRDLTDVDVLGIQAGDLLMWDGAKFVDATPNLALLADVDPDGPLDGDLLGYDDASGMWVPVAPAAGGGVTDHGDLDGLADDDHTQYALADGSRGDFAAPGHTHTATQISDSTTVGRAVVTATDAAAARTAIGAGTSSVTSVDDLDDVDTTTSAPSTGDVLEWDGTNWVPATPSGGGGATEIDDLTDVDTTTSAPSVGDVLEWDGDNWVPATPSGGSDPWTYAVASTTTSTTDNTTDTACAGLSIPSLADGVWEIHALIRTTSAAMTTGAQVGITQGTGMTTAATIKAPNLSSEAYGFIGEGQSGRASAVQSPVLGTPYLGAIIAGIITASSATGTVNVTLRSEVSGSQVQVLPGSFIKWRQIA